MHISFIRKRSVSTLQSTLLSLKKEREGKRAEKMQSLKVLWRRRSGIRSPPFPTHHRAFSYVPNPAAANDFDSEVSFLKYPSIFHIFTLIQYSRSFLWLYTCIRCWLKAKVVPELRFSTDPMFSMLSILQWCAFSPFKIAFQYFILFYFCFICVVLVIWVYLSRGFIYFGHSVGAQYKYYYLFGFFSIS